MTNRRMVETENRSQRLGIPGILLLIAALSFQARADVIHSAAFVNGVGQGGTGSSFESLGGGTATASAGYGVLKVSTLADGSADGNAYDAQATAGYSDTVTIFGAPTGTLGTMVVTFDILGSMSYSGNCTPLITGAAACFAAWSAGAADSGPTSINQGGRVDNIHGASGSSFGMQAATFSFHYGVPFTLSGSLTAEAYDDGLDNSSVSVDMSHSVYWGGISDVTANGQAFTSFSLTSDSGTDWTKSFIPTTGPSISAAPEPNLAAVIAMLAGAVFVLRRRASLARRFRHGLAQPGLGYALFTADRRGRGL